MCIEMWFFIEHNIQRTVDQVSTTTIDWTDNCSLVWHDIEYFNIPIQDVCTQLNEYMVTVLSICTHPQYPILSLFISEGWYNSSLRYHRIEWTYNATSKSVMRKRHKSQVWIIHKLIQNGIYETISISKCWRLSAW